MRHLPSIGPVRACALFTGAAALVAASWGLSNSSWAHATSHGNATQSAATTTAALPVIVMPTVTVIGMRDPSTTQSVKVARRAIREGLSSSVVQTTQ